MPKDNLLLKLNQCFELVIASWIGLSIEEIIFKIGLGLIGGEEDLAAFVGGVVRRKDSLPIE